MKDILGTRISIGDHVAFHQHLSGSSLHTGTVVGLSKERVKVRWVSFGSIKETYKTPKCLCVGTKGDDYERVG